MIISLMAAIIVSLYICIVRKLFANIVFFVYVCIVVMKIKILTFWHNSVINKLKQYIYVK